MTPNLSLTSLFYPVKVLYCLSSTLANPSNNVHRDSSPAVLFNISSHPFTKDSRLLETLINQVLTFLQLLLYLTRTPVLPHVSTSTSVGCSTNPSTFCRAHPDNNSAHSLSDSWLLSELCKEVNVSTVE